MLQGACPPAPLPGLPPIGQIALGNDNGYALDAEGQLWAWGARIGTGHPWPKNQIETPVHWAPVRVPGLPALRRVHVHPEGPPARPGAGATAAKANLATASGATTMYPGASLA